MKPMNKTELIAAAAKKCDLSQVDTAKALAAITQRIVETLQADQQVRLIGFGTFSRVVRKARTGINPLTKKPISIPEKKVVKFKPSKNL